jgi:hypothetical protein
MTLRIRPTIIWTLEDACPILPIMILRLALLSALCVFSGFGEEQGSKLLGKWRSVTTSKGGIGALLDFRPGGRFDYIPAAIVPGQYSVEEQRLTITDSNGEQTVMNIEAISTEALRLGMPKASSLDLKRVGRPEDPEHLLLGVWVTVHTMEGLPSRGYYYFRSDGTETFTVPFRTDQCLYAITGDRIRMTYPRQGSVEGAVRWEGDVLVLPWRGGEAKFKRF